MQSVLSLPGDLEDLGIESLAALEQVPIFLRRMAVRPRGFDELIGQDAMVRTLRNAIDRERGTVDVARFFGQQIARRRFLRRLKYWTV